MAKLKKYLRGHRREAVIAPVFKMLEACFELFVPLVMVRIIDVGIRGGNRAFLWRQFGLLILLAVVGLTCSLTAQYFAAKAAYGFGTALRKDLFHHINTFSYSELDTVGTPTLVTRMTSDINQVQNGLNLVLRLLLRSPFIIIGAVLMALSISPSLTLIFLAAAVVIALIITFLMRATVPAYRRAQNTLDEITLLTRENYEGARVVRAFSREGDEIDAFSGANDRLKTIQIAAGKISALMNPLTYLAVNLAILAVLAGGGEQVNTGRLTQGEVIALINYMGQILASLIRMADLVISVTRAAASAQRISEVLEIAPSMVQSSAAALPPQSGQPSVRFQNVSFSYPGSAAPSLTDISFAVQPGSVIGVIGGTGSGKSTLIDLVARFYDASAGEVALFGHPIAQYPFAQLRQMIGVVPQKAVLFTGTLRDNMRWGKPDASDNEIWHALEIAQADAFVRAKPQGLDMPVETGGRNFSGGQRQRLTIARALVGMPQILILDDSSSALDFATDAALRRALREKIAHSTVFLVSQRISTVRRADCILVLDDGALAGLGTHVQLLEHCPLYREICQSQLTQKEAERA
jgi:ATP-binding cassette subfamily B protein